MTSPANPPRKILILGATSAIAEATARLWAAQGAHLFLVARNSDKLDAIAADLKIRGAHTVDTTTADLDDIAAHPALLAHAVNALTGLDIAYLAHGIMGDDTLAQSNYAEARKVFLTNLDSPISLLTWLGNFCAQRHAGTLAVISSVAGDRGRKANYVYGASKAGLSAYLSGMRNRLDREGVTVLTIKPGPVQTPMTQGMKGYSKFADVDKVATDIVRAIDARRDVLYTPGIWRIIMSVVRHIPESIFKKLNF
jgi:decaprenylphospho-beta-D-erythro-pentofuranosid-2-ulose 2-reductase